LQRPATFVAAPERLLRDPLPDLERAAALLALILVGRHDTDATWGDRNVSRQRGYWLCGLIAALWLGGCASTEPPEVQKLQARAAYERGLAHLRDQQASSALSAFQEAISLDGTMPNYRNTLGVLYLDRLLRPDLALKEFERAAELDPTYAEAHLNTGIALAEMARWSEAVPAYRRAIAMPTLAVPHIAYQNLGLALYHLKQYREAEEALRLSIRLEPALEGPYYNLGLVLLAQGRQDEARVAFRQARDLAPQSRFGQAAVGQLKALGDGPAPHR
jgi:Tfp pilus assembly protein PilF